MHEPDMPDLVGTLRDAIVDVLKRNRVERQAYTIDEAAESLGVSRDYFDEHIRPELRVVRQGRRVLVPVKSLQEWLDRSATRVVDR